ncbi:hypothetical protein D9V28_13335 [Mycetocola zhadangensis]|uniref:Uncharacterized protein n=1 Tax=Mycetocola zhadangensis TaxID=1164595 RepID=A0A3L7ITF7_9MICO|nr:hypothetical protein D9V28_13335 [Mycetocola zhadangensis]
MAPSRSDQNREAGSLPGAAIVARVRRLLIVAVGALLGYSVLASASSGFCPGGVNSDGGFLDASGAAVDAAPLCVQLTLRPSVVVYLAVAGIVLFALGRVLRTAEDEHSARRILDRAALLVMATVVACVVISQVWFAMLPITEWDGTGTFVYPFPFGSVDMVTTPMTG